MSRPTARQLTATVACALAGLSTAGVPGASAAPDRRADLRVSAGALSVSGGQLSGTFTVANGGLRGAGPSSAAVKVRSGGRIRIVGRIAVKAVGPRGARTVKVRGLAAPTVSGTLEVCADGLLRIRERSERNNCRTVGSVVAGRTPAPVPGPVPPPPPPPAPAPQPAPGSSVPTAPIAFTKATILKPSTTTVPYFAYVSSGYDASHATATSLFVWMHGCGGQAEGDLNVVAPYSGEDYIAVSVGGRDGACWDVNADPAKVLATIADVKTHFNIDPRRVVLGGYSSGGDLAYRTAYENSTTIAGVLATNTAPFRDTGLTQQSALGKVTATFDVVHLAHLQDDTYPIATVRQEVDALKGAGFPVTLLERPGNHYDDSTPTTGTDRDIQALLLPHLKDGWTSAG